MPLPGNGSLSLQGHSRPGDAVQSKPKQAMIVRMTAETLEALSSTPSPQMDFEFGSNPGIYIGSVFLPMRPAKENMPHELYLRQVTAAKPMAPLKLYANVTGKFAVERELSKVSDKVRESTLGAVQQRAARQTIMIDTPPPPVTASASGGKKKKSATSMFRKPVQPSDLARPNLPASTGAVPAVASSTPRPSSSQDLIPVRRRLVHCLAVTDRPSDDAVRLVAGANADAQSKRDVLGLLEEIGERVTPPKKGEKPGSVLWRLKPTSWREVRPYEWPKLTETERTSMARRARQAFKALNIPETDLVWDHVRYRGPANNPTSSVATSTSRPNQPINGAISSDPPKRGVSSRDVKKKAAKPKASSNGEIMMKNESAVPKPRPGVAAIKNPPIDPKATPSPVLSQAAAQSRRVPGSGFKLTKNSPSDRQSETTPSPSLPPRPKAADVREKTRESLSNSVSTKPSPSVPPSERKSGKAEPVPHRPKKLKDSSISGLESDRESLKASTSRDAPRERDRPPQREQDWDMDWEPTDGGNKNMEKSRLTSSTAPLKRKKPPRDEEDPEYLPSRSAPSKRLKVDPAVRVASSSSQDTARKPSGHHGTETQDIARSKTVIKAETESPLGTSSRAKREPSPLSRPPSTKATSSLKDSSSSSSTKQLKSNGSSKVRRKSPMYTSSEDEGDERSGPSLPTPPANNSRSHQSHSSSRPRQPRPLPTDKAALRQRYATTYLPYLQTFQKIVSQRSQIERLLSGVGGGSHGSSTDDEGSVDLMDAEELSRLAAEHRRWAEELENIKQAFARSSD